MFSSLVYAAYKNWCDGHGELPLSIGNLKAALIDLNLTHKRTKQGSIWQGIKIKAE